MALKQITRVNIAEKVFEQLRDQILQGTWKEGEKLPSEQELTETLGVSRSSVRQAIRTLADYGMVETRNGTGTYVKRQISGNYMLNIVPIGDLQFEDIVEVLDFLCLIEDSVAEIINLLGEYSELKVRRALHNSRVLSSDVSAAFDPNYANAFEKKNIAYLGHGMVFNKYTGSRGKSGSNDACAEYIGALRKVMDDASVNWQTAELGKVDQGGGGTIAYITANYGMDVIDSGVALLNMHSPWEVSSKADIYEAYRGYKAFQKAEWN